MVDMIGRDTNGTVGSLDYANKSMYQPIFDGDWISRSRCTNVQNNDLLTYVVAGSTYFIHPIVYSKQSTKIKQRIR